MTDSLKCHSMADVRKAFATTCTVIGRYELEEILDAKGKVMARWPVVRMDGGDGFVLIESVWDPSRRHDAATVERFRGRMVAVTGRLHASPPGRIANMAVPCVSPVDEINETP